MRKMSDPVEAVWTDVGEAIVQPPRFLVENILPEGLTFLIGPPKNYKSAVELALLLTACGVENSVLPPDLSKCEEPGRVMLLSAEAEAGVLRHTVESGFRVTVPNDMRFLVMSDPWKFRLDDRNDMAQVLDWAEELDTLVLAIDPLRNFHSLDENDAGGMVMMLQALQQWAVKNRKAALVLHHSRKVGEDKEGSKRNTTPNDMRGTSALFGMADCVLTSTAKGKGVVHLSAVMKRAEAWERTIQLGIWGQTPNESIDAECKMVFELLRTGLTTSAVGKAMKLSAATVQSYCAKLTRLGALTPGGVPAPEGGALVEGAVRKYMPTKK